MDKCRNTAVEMLGHPQLPHGEIIPCRLLSFSHPQGAPGEDEHAGYVVRRFQGTSDVALFAKLYEADLSERYTTNIYRYFISCPELTFVVEERSGGSAVAAVTASLKGPTDEVGVGYIGMLAVQKEHRRKGLARLLVQQILEQFYLIKGMTAVRVDTEVGNQGALSVYEAAGFVRESFRTNFYMNGNHAYTLLLMLADTDDRAEYQALYRGATGGP